MSINYDTFIPHLIQDIDYLSICTETKYFKPLNIENKSKRVIMWIVFYYFAVLITNELILFSNIVIILATISSLSYSIHLWMYFYKLLVIIQSISASSSYK